MRACKTAKGIEKQLKRDHIAKFKDDILNYLEVDWSKLKRNAQGSLEWEG